MKIELSKEEYFLIKKILSKQIEDIVGISYPQSNFIRNMNNGMIREKAMNIYINENKEFWKKMIYEEKNPIFLIFNKFFKNENLFI